MKRIIPSLFCLALYVEGFSQVELDYSATPKAQATGMSKKGLKVSDLKK